MSESLTVRSEGPDGKWLVGWWRDGDNGGWIYLLTAMRSTPQDLDCLHVVGGVETQLPVVQAPFAPTLLVFFPEFGQFIAWRGRWERGSSLQVLELLVPPRVSPDRAAGRSQDRSCARRFAG